MQDIQVAVEDVVGLGQGAQTIIEEALLMNTNLDRLIPHHGIRIAKEIKIGKDETRMMNYQKLLHHHRFH